MGNKIYLEWECIFELERRYRFSVKITNQDNEPLGTVYLGSIFSMFINVNNPALHVRNSLAVLLVCSLQHGAAARIKGWTALGLHLGGEGGLVSCLALDVVNLQHSQL